MDKPLYQGQATSVTVPGLAGQLQVLDHHVSILTGLKKGSITVTSEKGEESFEIESGVLEVKPGEVNILVS